jgi:1,4-alpha-glucan branching enzyme
VMQQFTFTQKGLKSVAIVGSLNNWDETATPMTEVSPGVWTVTMPLPPGVYQYQFILDGERRVTDPSAPQQPSDFGSPNSVITVSSRVP